MNRHDRPTSRRDFLREGLRSLVRAGFGGVFEKLERMGELMERGEPKPAPLMPVLSCETRTLHPLLETGQLTLESCCALLRDLDIQGISLSSRHLQSLHPRYLENLRETCYRHNLAITGVMVSEPVNLNDEPSLNRRLEEAIEYLQAAAVIGAPLIRLHLSGEREDELFERSAHWLQRLLPEARRRRVRITIENREGIGRRPELLISLIRAVDPRWVGVCLDFGHGDPERIYDATRLLAPYAFHVHAKSHAFDPRGEETSLDYGRLLSSLRLASYVGALSIEYFGEGDLLDGIRKTRDMIRRYWRAY
ncbi:MAG: sugar phosphate isomerase/epimerase [Fimbriimonadales bacterium]|nr:sugar phosphate isomerase/epimerase [Fimbriimonadales bacterium]MDW8051603.1 sugar phosphate isomerase/epimerase family protein [Armatimonadota bacterium]